MWDEYLDNLAYAVHNMRMLLDGTIVLGGYLGAYIGDYMDDLCERVDQKNPFGDKAKDYLQECGYKTEAAASGAGIYFIDRFMANI